jgi:hypothetical protein
MTETKTDLPETRQSLQNPKVDLKY